MIPNPKQVDPDLAKIFNDVPNTAFKQTVTPTVVNVPKDHVESSRAIWSENTTNMMAFEYGFMMGSAGDSNAKPDVRTFLLDLFKSLRQCITNEITKIDSSDKSHDIYLALQHMINVLAEKYRNIETNSSAKINTEAIVASFHGFITSYIISNYKPNLKK